MEPRTDFHVCPRNNRDIKSALLELGLSLQMYRNDMVLSGGWAPYFITEKYFEHCGSIDIDLVLKTSIMPKYESIRNIVTSLGYVEENHFRFERKYNLLSMENIIDPYRFSMRKMRTGIPFPCPARS